MTMNDFHWQTDLSEVRKRQIVKWVNALTSDKRLMVEQLRDETKSETAELENQTADM